MYKKTAFVFFLIFGLLISSAYAVSGISIEIGSDRTVSSGTNIQIVAELGGMCSNSAHATIYWMEMNDKGDWSTKQSGGVDNLSYSFTASVSKQVKAQYNCPLGSPPLFTSEVVASDIITITVSTPDPVVSAGADFAYTPGQTVELQGSITGTTCSVFDYTWQQISGPTVTITNASSTLLASKQYAGASFVFPDTTESIGMRLSISPQSCIHAGNTYIDEVVFSKRLSGGGPSWNSRMEDEATAMFFSDQTVKDLPQINLSYYRWNSMPILYFEWNLLGGEGQVVYELEYSTDSNFSHPIRFETTNRLYQIWEEHLDAQSDVYYFRVRAGFRGKYTSYSNTLRVYPVELLELSKCKHCKMVNFFESIFDEVDDLIDSYLITPCTIGCKKNHFLNR